MDSFQWRIRNLPYPEEVYVLDVDPEKQEVVIKTTIKKYYKRFQIPDMLRADIKLNKDNLSFKYSNNTLIVSVTFLLHVSVQEAVAVVDKGDWDA